jgi:hypothetical protein
MAALCVAVALMGAIASASGLFLRGSGASAETQSPRGEAYRYAIDGVYRFNAIRVVAEGAGWDAFTLFFAVPALLAAVPSVARSSLRGRLFAVGMLAYFFYQYLMYAMAWAFGPLFPLFILEFAASAAAIAWIVSSLDIARLAARFSGRFPRRGMAGLCIALSATLVFMWGARIASALDGKVDGILLGQTTLVVQALDLGLIVPLAFFTAVSALRRKAVGYLLCPTLVVKAVAMSAAICAMLLSAWKTEGTLEVAPLALFASAGAVSAFLGIRMFRSVLPESPASH